MDARQNTARSECGGSYLPRADGQNLRGCRPHPCGCILLRLGFVASLCLAARDVERALQTALLYGPLWSRGRFRYERAAGGDAVLRMLRETDGADARVDAAETVLLWRALASAVAGRALVPVWVAAPARARGPLRAQLGCPVHERDEVAMQIAAADLAVDNARADARLYALLESVAAQRLEEATEGRTMSERLRRLLAVQADVSNVRVARTSRALGTSPRTLSRRLFAEGTSFRKVVAEVRLEHCLRQLAAGRMSGKQVAHELGFADASSFHRAFKRWTGTTVSAYRQRAARARRGK